MTRPVFLAGLLALALLIVAASLAAISSRRLSVEMEQLRADLDALQNERATETQRLEALDHRVNQLRDEATQSRQLREELSRLQAIRERPKGTAPSGAEAQPTGRSPATAQRGLSLEGLPAAVRQTLLARDADLEITQLDLVTEGDQRFYQVQGRTADGRRVGMRLTPEGGLESSKSEITAELLPNAVRDTLAQGWDGLSVNNAREVVQKDAAMYTIDGRLADGRRATLNLNAEGGLVASETEVPFAQTPAMVQTAISRMMGDAATSTVNEIFKQGQVIYQVGVKNEAQYTTLLVGQDGTLISYDSKSVKNPKPVPGK